MERNLKKIILVLLSVILMCGLMSVSSFAAGSIAIPSVDSRGYIRTYCLAASGRISVYTNESLTSQKILQKCKKFRRKCKLIQWLIFPLFVIMKAHYRQITIQFI